MDPNIAEKLRSEFSDVEDLGWQRIYAARTISYDTSTHRRLPGWNDRKILSVLMFANSLAKEVGAEKLKMSIEEKKLWARHFLIAVVFLGLCLFFNYFGDEDH